MTSKTGLKADVSLEDEDGAGVEAVTEETPESVLLARVESEVLQAALKELPVNYREVILLCDLEEMSYQEISAAIGVPMGTVMSRLSRGRRALRKLVESGLEGASS